MAPMACFKVSELLVGIEIEAVVGHEEGLDVAPVFSQPGLYGLAVMHPQVVQKEEDLLAAAPGFDGPRRSPTAAP